MPGQPVSCGSTKAIMDRCHLADKDELGWIRMLTIGLLLLAGGCGSDSAGGGPRSDVNYWRAGLRAAPAPAGLSGIIGFDRTLLVPGRADPLTHDLVLASANAGFHAPDAA